MANDTLIKQRQQKAAWADSPSDFLEQSTGYQKCETKKNTKQRHKTANSSPHERQKEVH